MDKLILDVGCGLYPHGDVNIDIPWSEPHRDGKTLRPKKTRNFIFASSEYLPFRDNIFDEVVSYHLLEHLEAPLITLSEMVRVTRDVVKVVVPSFSFRGECGEHLYTWGEGSLHNILRKAGLNDVKVRMGYFSDVEGNISKFVYKRSYVLGNFLMIAMRKLYGIELQGKGRKRT